MNILKKLGIDAKNLFGLIEVNLENDKVVLHIAQMQGDANPLEVMVRAMLVAKIEQAIGETVDAVSTAMDMMEGVGCIDADEFYDDDDGDWGDISEEEIEAELERSKREIQQMYDNMMASALRKNGRLN